MRRKRDYTDFGLWVASRLAECNMTRLELSERTGIKKSVISDVLTGRNRKAEHKEKITEILMKEAQ